MAANDLRFEFIPTAVYYEVANDWDTILKMPCQNDLKEGNIKTLLMWMACSILVIPFIL